MLIKKTDYTKDELKLFRRLNSPIKVQDYLNSIPFNFEKNGDTCMSPRMVLKTKRAHCVEGALLAAATLEFHGHKPWLLDLRSTTKPWDYDHVIAVFKKGGYFGAISKTNHAVLRYREPIYKTVRELVMSFFHEYFLDNGKKTLREYSKLFDLSKLKINWHTSEKNLFEIPNYLDKAKHYKILSQKQIRNLRKADKIEIDAGKLVEYRKTK